MPKVRKLETRAGVYEPDLAFLCPACRCAHGVATGHGDRGWTWNGDAERPTITPSVKVTGYEMNGEGLAMLERGEEPAVGERYPGRDTCCHSNITDGWIEFCGDCTHGMVGQRVELPEF